MKNDTSPNVDSHFHSDLPKCKLLIGNQLKNFVVIFVVIGMPLYFVSICLRLIAQSNIYQSEISGVSLK